MPEISFSGHQGASNMFDSNGRNNTTYDMYPDWCAAAYTVAYQNYMTPWYTLYTKRNINPSTFAVGQILKVFGMHRITDMYDGSLIRISHQLLMFRSLHNKSFMNSSLVNWMKQSGY
ncbi:SusD/RagB family nutrient-binding outer membrane lipoprotein [Bacteroides ovatus]|nr:SusD/RagB family nutrient-binding outer membrane lipoprotein [Bacteroides ovatus]